MFYDIINKILAETYFGYRNITLDTSFEEGSGIYNFTINGREGKGYLPDFTNDIALAWELVYIIQDLYDSKYACINVSWCNGWEVDYYNVEKEKSCFLAEDNDICHAICKAALKIAGVETNLFQFTLNGEVFE